MVGVDVPVLAARSVGMRFGGLQALQDVDIEVRSGSTTALIGANGAGKTTLVNILSGLAAPTSGAVLYKGRPTKNWRLSTATRAGVVRTFQANRVFADLTVTENLLVGALNARSPIDVTRVLEVTGLAHRADTHARSLPFGEIRRLGVALALSTSPDVLLLDEPGAGLTGDDLTALALSIREISAEGKAVLLIDHNMRFVMASADRVTALDCGRVITTGSPTEVQASPRV
ncbi:MAG: ABC transporter ATP-binding protein, partial [Actinomycetes bacterium]